MSSKTNYTVSSLHGAVRVVWEREHVPSVAESVAVAAIAFPDVPLTELVTRNYGCPCEDRCGATIYEMERIDRNALADYVPSASDRSDRW